MKMMQCKVTLLDNTDYTIDVEVRKWRKLSRCGHSLTMYLFSLLCQFACSLANVQNVNVAIWDRHGESRRRILPPKYLSIPQILADHNSSASMQYLRQSLCNSV